MTTVVLWVENFELAKDFYRDLLGGEILDQSGEFARVSSGENAVLLHLVAEKYREGVANPPAVREDTVMKPVYKVASISQARRAVATSSGCVYSADREKLYGLTRYCDGFDTEGNVFQLAEG